MSALRARQELTDRLNDLSDDQVITLLEFIKSMQPVSPKQGYDPDADPLLTGELAFKAGHDFAEKSEDILQTELGIRKNVPGESS